MKKFRVKNLTVAVGGGQQLQKCGVNFSCPGGAGSICHITNGCNNHTLACGNTVICGRSLACPTQSLDCHWSFGCPLNSLDCRFTGGGCGLNYSTLPPTDFTHLVDNVIDITDKLDLIDTLKADLNLAVKNLGAVEKDLAQQAQPQTLAEAKEVEKNLEGALKEVKGMMKGLK